MSRLKIYSRKNSDRRQFKKALNFSAPFLCLLKLYTENTVKLAIYLCHLFCYNENKLRKR